jgi:hypothetical protein
VALDPTAWSKTWNEAVKSGAVPQSVKYKTLTEKIEAWKKVNTAFLAAAERKKQLVEAKKELGKLADVHAAISTVADRQGVSDNQQMDKWLADLRDKVIEREEQARDFLGGADVSFTAPPFDWEPKGAGAWATVKDSAVAAALLGDTTTGFTPAIKTADKHWKKANSAKGAKKVKAAQVAESSLLQMIELARAMQADTKNPALHQYFVTTIAAAEQRRLEMQRITQQASDNFAPAPFTWANKTGWQVVKKAASDAGLLDAGDTTGFGATIDDAVKARASHDKAEPGKRQKQELDALAKYDALIRAARELRGRAKHARLQGYFDQAVAEAEAKKREISLAPGTPGAPGASARP